MTVTTLTPISSDRSTTNGTVPKLITSTSPATGRVLGQVRAATPDEVTAAMERSRQAQPHWAALSLPQRVRLVHQFKDALYRNFDRIVEMMVAEQGKQPFEAITEFLPSIELLHYYVHNARHILAPYRIAVRVAPHYRNW